MATSALLAFVAVAAPPAVASDHLIPPPAYRADDFAVVFFVSDVPAACGIEATPGLEVRACAQPDRRVIILPNPCLYAPYEYFARLACHESAHLQGWIHP